MNKLKEKWGVQTNLDFILILLVFSVTGSAATLLARPVLEAIGMRYEEVSGWLFWPVRIVLLFIIYQVLLVLVGWLFGQSKFFWKMEKKMLKRLRILK